MEGHNMVEIENEKGRSGGNGGGRTTAESFEIKVGLAEMLKGGVIMDVTTPEQAKIAEDAGAAAVMALERVPADIRREGGVARMCARPSCAVAGIWARHCGASPRERP
jgi:hypothetical protein